MLLNHLGAILTINKALNTEIGTEISNDKKVIYKVFIKINNTP